MYLDFLEITISDLIFVFHYFFLSFFSKWQLVIHDLFIYKERLGKTFAGRALFCSCIVVNRQFWAAYIVYTHWSTSLLHNTHVCEGGGSRIREGIAMGDDLGGESFSNHKIGLEKAGGETRCGWWQTGRRGRLLRRCWFLGMGGWGFACG